ncbi:hypothetical protein D1155_07750 [Anaerotruncus sp. 80]|uniref:YqbQ/XkdQ domain-containing protein n=1 Tax=Anaerotruncus colihominis TaxID=169435 RepID=A0A845QHD6_9FIRM|nr:MULTISPECIES: hypothetical protein [Anaerotruncus]NBH61540.1 hypothetical protein [Anaerotruncus colihominis]NCF02195.1 hypothetical protein [Anaerotruncus sp. 80]
MNYEIPTYKVVVKSPDGKTFDTAGIITGLTLTESKSQLAQRATIRMFNRYISKHGYPSNLFPVRSRVFIYAKGGGKTKREEVFRGYVWDTDYSLGNGTQLTLTCYDNMIYFMNSQILTYFSKGKSTKEIVKTLMERRGVKLTYNYSSITHPKLPLSGTLADVLTSELLDEVQKKKGVKYVVKSKKGKIYIDKQGSNEKAYCISRGSQSIMQSYNRSVTMDGMVTSVIIAGKSDENGKRKIEERVDKNRKTYGTLAKIIYKDEDTKLSEVKKEANYILDENATPQREYEVTALDIPWIRKGDRVRIEFNKGTYHDCVVNEITHNCDQATMTLNVRRMKKK